MRTSLARAARPLAQSSRLFSTSVRVMADGVPAGSNRGSGGQQDSFQKREEASENLYIRQEEQKKLQQLREKIKQHQESLDALEKDINKMGKK